MTSSREYVIIAAFASGLVALPTSAIAQGSSKCRPADPYSAMLIGTLKDKVTSHDSTVIWHRDNTYHVPVVPVNQIALVTDERICTKIVQAYAALPHGAYTPTRVYVIRMGSLGTVALDPDAKAGEFNVVHIFNSKYVEIGGWVGG
jgi:hypothetical protein